MLSTLKEQRRVRCEIVDFIDDDERIAQLFSAADFLSTFNNSYHAQLLDANPHSEAVSRFAKISS
jgi:hypothetical protein